MCQTAFRVIKRVSKRILVVEDDSLVANVLIRAIHRKGHEAVHARSMAEADNILASTRVEGAVIDLWLDEGSGIEVANLIHRCDAEIPVVFFSGDTTSELATQARSIAPVLRKGDSLGVILTKLFETLRA